MSKTGTPAGEDPASVVVAMLASAPAGALAELERKLLADLFPRPEAAEQRWRELGLLAHLLDESEDGPLPDRRPPSLPREHYDAVWTAPWPRSRELVDGYGSWKAARRAAFGLLPDGRYRGMGKPWRTPSRGRPRVFRDDRRIDGDVLQCARSLGRRPTTEDYFRWQRARASRLPGQPAAVPCTLRTILARRRTWAKALRAARISDAELTRVRARWAHPSPEMAAQLRIEQRLPHVDDAAWERVGLTQAESERVLAEGPGQLPVDRALALARELHVSLDWLAGLTGHPGEAPAATRMDGSLVSAAFRAAGATEREMCGLLDWTLGGWRRLVRSSEQPTLADAAEISLRLDTSLNGMTS